MIRCTGCVFLRDAKGNPGEMILKHEEITEAEARALDKKILRATYIAEKAMKQNKKELHGGTRI